MQAIRCSSVRLATRLGAEERSSNPAGPSARARATHFAQVRSLTPAASAASVIDRPCASTIATISRRRIRLRRALACNFIRCPPWDWTASDTSSLKGGPDEQPPQELHLGPQHPHHRVGDAGRALLAADLDDEALHDRRPAVVARVDG